jgi:hypothetical protein
MRKFLTLSMVLFLVPATGVYTQERADVVEAFTPSPAMLFVKTSRVKDLVDSVNFFARNLLVRDTGESMNKKREEFKRKTGVDPLDAESLKNAGIDVDRSLSFAMYPPVGSHEDRTLIFIPIKDEKIFPLKFVEILKKLGGDEGRDLYPVITEYRNHTVFQIRKDIFSTAFDGEFMVASTGELIQRVIDVKVDNAGYLSLDPQYMDYMSRTTKNYDFRAYATRDLLKQAPRIREKFNDMLREKKEEEGPEKMKGGKGSYTLRTVPFHMIYAGAKGEDKPQKKPEEIFSEGPSPFNSVEYASLGITVEPSDVAVDLAVKFNNTNPRVNIFLGVIRTGMFERAIYVDNAAASAFISIDFDKLEELCGSPGTGCAYYEDLKKTIHSELGIDFRKDFIPYYSGIVDVVAGRPKGAGGGYLIYLPMSGAGQGKGLWNTIGKYLEGKYKGTGRFGTGRIGASDSFWFIDSRSSRIYSVCDTRGLYIGNDPELIKTALSSRLIKDAPEGNFFTKKLDLNVFSFAHVSKESLFGALATLFAYRHKSIRRLGERMADFYIVGKKTDSYVSIDLVVNLLKQE